MTIEKPHLIEIISGDWSRDGHGLTDTDVFISSHNYNAICQALFEAKRTLNLNLDNVCSDYQDHVLPRAIGDLLVAEGFDTGSEDGFEERDGDYYMDRDTWLAIHIFLIQYANPLIELHRADAKKLHIGGYGLFSL